MVTTTTPNVCECLEKRRKSDPSKQPAGLPASQSLNLTSVMHNLYNHLLPNNTHSFPYPLLVSFPY